MTDPVYSEGYLGDKSCKQLNVTVEASHCGAKRISLCTVQNKRSQEEHISDLQQQLQRLSYPALFHKIHFRPSEVNNKECCESLSLYAAHSSLCVAGPVQHPCL